MNISSRRVGLGAACLLGALVACTDANAQLRAPALASADRAACEQEAQLLFPPHVVTRASRTDAGPSATGRQGDLNWSERRYAEHRCQVVRRHIMVRG